MNRVFFIIVVLILLGLGGGFLWLGAFPPPAPHASVIQKTIPVSAVGAG